MDSGNFTIFCHHQLEIAFDVLRQPSSDSATHIYDNLLRNFLPELVLNDPIRSFE